MKLLLLFTLAFTTFSTFVSTYEMDITMESNEKKDVFKRTLFDSFADSRQVLLFLSKYEDGFDTVLEGKEKVWTDGKDFRCEFVKVFYWEKQAEAVKLGLKTSRFSDVERKFNRSAFFLKRDGKWSEVERKEYFDFLKARNLPNYSHRDYEKDERFETKDETEPVEIALRPLWADLRVKPKPLPKNIVNVAPSGGDPSPLVPKDDEDHGKVKVVRNLKKETDSFLTSSLLLSAGLMVFSLFN